MHRCRCMHYGHRKRVCTDVDVCITDTVTEYAQMFDSGRKFSCLSWDRNAVDLARCLPQSPVQAADGPAHSVWRQPNTDPVGCRSAPGKNSGYAARILELYSSSAHNGPTTRITALAGPLQCLTKGLADLNLNGLCKILTLADDGLIYKTSKDSQEAAETLQQQLDSVSK